MLHEMSWRYGLLHLKQFLQLFLIKFAFLMTHHYFINRGSSIQKIIKQPLSAIFELRALMTSLKVKFQVQNYRSAPTGDQILNYIIFSHVINLKLN